MKTSKLFALLRQRVFGKTLLVFCPLISFIFKKMSFFGQGKKRGSVANDDDMGIMARFSRSVSDSPITDATKRVANDAAYVSKKLLKSTGKAAWFAGTTLLILVVPLIIAMDREQQFNELALQQQGLLGSPPPLSPPK